MEQKYTIRDLQLSILIILKEIKRICDKNNIEYILDAGTVLGAVRHGGFIPWDDDADIAMERKEYEKFKEVCRSGALSKEFFFQDYPYEKRYHHPFIRIRLENTLCELGEHVAAGYKHLGVFVDIFPLDYINKCDAHFLDKRIKKIKKNERAITNKLAPIHPTIKSKIYAIVLSCISLKHLFKKRFKYERLFGNENSKYITSTYSSYKPEKVTFPIEIIKEKIVWTFEGINFYIPKNYDYYLTTMYGDYMKLPPKEKQVGHLPSKIIL